MAELYWYGVYLNLVWGVFASLALPFKLNSTFARNMDTIGYRISWASGEPVMKNIYLRKKTINDYFWKFIGFAALHAICSLLSWLNLVFIFIKYVKVVFSFLATPTEVKTARWRLRNLILNKGEVISQLCIVRGSDALAQERLRTEIDEHLDYLKTASPKNNEVA